VSALGILRLKPARRQAAQEMSIGLSAAVDQIQLFVFRWHDGSFSQHTSLGDGQIVSPSFAHDRTMHRD
tara:strand:- start:7485 stop:7691 length:207 start_codon:yes stop_codon:yes gene_type:complete